MPEPCLCHKSRETFGCRDETCINRIMKVECAKDICRCGAACQNQRFQNRQFKKVEVYKTRSMGFGLRACETVEPGEFVIEYVGEVICEEETRRRIRNYSNEKNFYLLATGQGETIDASRRGNKARFCNHDCDPSCETAKWNVLGEMRVGVFANRRLEKGDPITFDYKFERVTGSKKQPCMCGARNCRQFLGNPPKNKDGSRDANGVSAASGSERLETGDFGTVRKKVYPSTFAVNLKQASRSLIKTVSLPMAFNTPAGVTKRRARVFLHRNKRRVRAYMTRHYRFDAVLVWDPCRERKAAAAQAKTGRRWCNDQAGSKTLASGRCGAYRD